MIDEEFKNQLMRFANKLSGNKYSRFKSKFISIVNILKHNMRIAEAVKSGSIEKDVSLDDISDLDIIYTFIETEKTSDEIRHEAFIHLNSSFPNDNVTEGNRAVKVEFSENRKYDVVYKPYSDYEAEKNEIRLTKESTNEIKNIIKLLRYWVESQKKDIDSYKLEKIVLYHEIHNQDKSFENLLIESIKYIGDDPEVVLNLYKQKKDI